MSLFNRSLSYGGLALPVAAVGTHLQGQLPAGATAAIVLLGLTMLLGRARISGLLPRPGRRSRRVAAPALALVLVASLTLSGVGPTGVESAAAVTSGGTCSYASVLHWFGVSTDQCGPSAPDTSTAENKVEARQSAAEIKSWSETSRTQTNNSLTNLQTTLYASGQAVQVKAIKNGSSATEVNQRVNESINERVAKMQYNQLQAWNQRIQSILNLIRETQSAGIGSFLISYALGDNGSGWSSFPLSDKADHFGRTNVTLANGTTYEAWYYDVRTSSRKASNGTASDSPEVWTVSHMPADSIDMPGNTGDHDFAAPYRFSTKPINDQPRIYLLDSEVETTSAENWNSLERKAQLAKENLAATTPSLVDQRAAGELNVSEVVNPTTLAQEYATKYESTGNLAYARATAAASGYATPSLSNVSVMNVSTSNLTYTGALFSQSAPPNGTWVLNETYSTSTIDGTQLVATTSGEMVELDGEFTISSMRDANGETLNETSVREYSYETSNASQYIKLQQELNDLREEVANQTASTPGGGSSSGIDPKVLGALLLLGVGAYLARKGGDDNDRGRR